MIISRKIIKLILASVVVGGFIFTTLFGVVSAFGGNRWTIISKIPKTQRRAIKEIVKTLADAPYFFYHLTPHKLTTYELFVDEKDLRKLEDALPKNDTAIFEAEDVPYVKAKLVARDKEYDVKIKYRGTTSQHWSYQKKSIRVKFKNGEIFNGMSEINLAVPESRGYVMEAFNNYRAGKLELPVFKDDFVNLKINGEKFGTYYLSEGFTKEFLERDNELTADTNLYGEKTWSPNLYKNIDAWKKYVVNPSEDENNMADLKEFLDVLNTPSDAEFYKKIGSILDLNNFFNWNVHSILSGSFHQDFEHNARLYFDTTIGKFKFIPWQVLAWPAADFKDYIYNPVAARILKNPEFLKERNRRLYTYVSNGENLADDLAAYDKILARVRHDLLRDTKAQEHISTMIRDTENYRRVIENNFKFIHDEYFKTNVESNVVVSKDSRVPVVVEISIEGQTPITVSGLSITNSDSAFGGVFEVYDDANANTVFDVRDRRLGAIRLFGEKTNTIKFNAPLEYSSEVEYSSNDIGKVAVISFPKKKYRIFLVNWTGSPLVTKNLKIEIDAVNSTTGVHIGKDEVAARIFDGTNLHGSRSASSSIDEFVARHTMFVRGRDSLILGPGNYAINETIIIPPGTKVLINSGANLALGENVSIVSYSPVTIAGTSVEPVKFFRATSRPWGVFAILDVGAPTTINNAIFNSGGGTSSETFISGARITGMVAIHTKKGASVNISKSKFLNSLGGDDALNVKYAKLVITDSEFSKNKFDGLDVDFGTGEIANNKFYNNGNDGIDISGSTVVIANNHIEGNGDKGISVGEGSHPQINDNSMVRNNIGIAIKDASVASLKKDTIYDNTTGIALYEKKGFFGASSALIDGSIIWNNDRQFDAGKDSKLEITNSNVQGGYEGAGNYAEDPKLNF